MSAVLKRIDLLENAVYKKNNGIKKTIFDVYNDKISELETFLRTETKRQQD